VERYFHIACVVLSYRMSCNGEFVKVPFKTCRGILALFAMDAIDKKYPTPEMKELFEAISSIQDKEEAAEFFRDLLTIAEITEFANRWQMVKYLLEDKLSYAEIASKLKTSTTTVTRVALWLNHGMGGYKKVAERVFKK
jgi:TrpR-related protein YerC/YecD